MTEVTAQAETTARQELAACYRMLAHYGMTDLVSTHVSARVPGTETLLINRYGLLFEEVTASNLVRIGDAGEDGVNPAGHLIHTAIHEARPDVACVIHTHTAAGIAVSCQADGLLPLSQHAIQFHDRIGYHDYEGVVLEDAERVTLVRDLGHHHAMILRNHGLLTAGRTIAEAFTLMVNLERACQIQVRALAGGVRVVPIAEHVREPAARQHDAFAGMDVGEPEWAAMMRLVRKVAPDYAD